jgi:N-acetylglucosaminyl-diphospho-decaprenol L-rhamnosyltransferase
MWFVPSDLDVIIVTYNSALVVGDLLDSLPAAFGDISYDVIVVDNGSADGTADLLEARGDCRVVRSTNVGYAGGINRGVREATGADAILILNPDALLGERSVGVLLEALQLPDVGIVVPQVQSPDGAIELSLRREPTLGRALGLNRTGLALLSEYVTSEAQYSRPQVVDWAMGAVMLMSRKCYDVVGGLDESYFLYSEETDLLLRARDAGFQTRYEPRSIAVHIGGGSGRNDKTHMMQIVNRVRLYRRRHGEIAAWCYFWLTILSEITWIARGHPQSRAAVRALLRPSRRPAELGCSDRLMPR